MLDAEHATHWRHWQTWSCLLLGTWLAVLSEHLLQDATEALAASELLSTISALLVLVSLLTHLSAYVTDELQITEEVFDITFGFALIALPPPTGYPAGTIPTINTMTVGTLLVALCVYLEYCALQGRSWRA